MELCLEYARAKRNLSVDGIAELMGQSNKWVIYKWLENGRLPAILIRPFEHACGCTFITQYIATSAHKLLVDIPNGQPATDDELLGLHNDFNVAVTLLSNFYKGRAEADDTISALTSLLSQLAGHRANVSKALTPELGLFDEPQGDQR
jgi:hypothetical protein